MPAPNTYPPQPFAKVHVAWAVISIVPTKEFSYVIAGLDMKDPTAKYKTYQTNTESFFLDTDLTNFPNDVPPISQTVYDYYNSLAASSTSREIHWSIKLDNPTAARPPLGAWVQAKGHMDGHLTESNIKSVEDITHPILEFIPFIQKVAKY